jgi:hypothetical protein
MVRPETLVLVPLFLADDWWRAPRSQWRTMSRRSALVLGLTAALLLPYVVLNLQLSGSPFPTTFAARWGRRDF